MGLSERQRAVADRARADAPGDIHSLEGGSGSLHRERPGPVKQSEADDDSPPDR